MNIIIRGKITTQCFISPTINYVKLCARIFPSTIISLLFDYAKNLVRCGNFSLGRALLFFRPRARYRTRGRIGQRATNFYVVVTKRDYTFARQLRTLDANDLSADRFPFPLLFPSFSLARSLLFRLSLLPRRLCSWCVHARARPVYSRARNQFTRRDLWCDRR